MLSLRTFGLPTCSGGSGAGSIVLDWFSLHVSWLLHNQIQMPEAVGYRSKPDFSWQTDWQRCVYSKNTTGDVCWMMSWALLSKHDMRNQSDFIRRCILFSNRLHMTLQRAAELHVCYTRAPPESFETEGWSQTIMGWHTKTRNQNTISVFNPNTCAFIQYVGISLFYSKLLLVTRENFYR